MKVKITSLNLRFDLLLGLLIFNFGYTNALQEFILDTEPITEPSWTVSGCEYFDKTEDICPEFGIDFGDSENGVGYWTSSTCGKNNCSLIYTAQFENAKPEGFAFRIFGLGATSHLILSWDSGESRLPVNNNGSWMEYPVIKGDFQGSTTLTLTMSEESEGIIIFDKMLVQTSNEVTTPTYETTAISTLAAESSSRPITDEYVSTAESDLSTTETFDDSSTTPVPVKTSDPGNPTNVDESTISGETSTTSNPSPTPRIDVLDTIDDLGEDSPWRVINCVYGSSVEDLRKSCVGITNGDPELLTGYWSPCRTTTCQIIYRGSVIPGNSTSPQSRQVSFRAFIPDDSQISVTTEKGFEIIFSSGDWTDISFFGVNVTDVITFTARNSGIEQVIFDEIRVKSIEDFGSTTPSPPEENDMSELYLLLILIAVCLVAALMTALVVITCFRRVCCKPRKPKPGDEDSLGMQYQDFRTMPVKLPVPPISPPPGYLHQDYSAGLSLQPSTFHLNKLPPPPPNPKPLPKPEPEPEPSTSTSTSTYYGHGNYGKASASPYGKSISPYGKASTSPYGKGHIYYSGVTPTPRSRSPENKVEPPILPRLAKTNAYSNHPTL